MQIKQTISVAIEGKSECKHSFLTNGIGTLYFMPLVKSILRRKWRQNADIHTIERICFNCGHLEIVDTHMDWSSPFSFAAVISRFKDQLPNNN